MKKCLKINVLGKIQGVSFRSFIQKKALDLDIEGTIQNENDGSVIIYACGPSDKLDKFIDMIYKGNSTSKVTNLTFEPLVKEKDFRSVFRIIGE